MPTLFTPWRYEYITAAASQPAGCFLCEAAACDETEEEARLVVARTPHHLVVVNRHPYSNGHLLVAPRRHHATPAGSDAAERAELWGVVLRAQEALERLYAPHGMNLGMNLGTCAGAGLPGHFHLHLVPRWNGDTNFMSVVAETRLVPEEPATSWRRIREVFLALAPGESRR
ncbi:MAG: HIT domain-containing protein [Thermoanaerobaculia bacterium]|jgi:ATP adenylyltransferase|nr:HIT domain-containing protein [Thermoanaerobaculia bacterium]MDI9630733.1 HIT domain-containing protein [Acidobacteriota bacterium]OQC40932.1 MAG: AP-4-A phosphorylase [Acidobacteria bacterium ADurb.Bin051]MBP7813935.1 HIT domain-containing protein [Thermoanaerobaculia bacterium]HPA95119.1 HIT domain-containing protein [Thermoanaerobaculia bacterium]